MFVEKMLEQLAELEKVANEALASKDMDRHMEYGKRYHLLASEILDLTGKDPRPYAEVFYAAR